MAQHGTALPGTARTAARGEEPHGAAAVQTELVSLAEKRCRSRPCVFSTGEPRAPTADGEGDPDQVPCSPAPRLPLTPPLLHPQVGASPGTPHISGGSCWQPRPWQLLGVPEPRRHRCHRPTVRTRSREPPASRTQRDRTGQQRGWGHGNSRSAGSSAVAAHRQLSPATVPPAPGCTGSPRTQAGTGGGVWQHQDGGFGMQLSGGSVRGHPRAGG